MVFNNIEPTVEFNPCISGVTRGGRVVHPWKVWGKILEGRGKGGKREGRGKKRMKGKREARKKGNGEVKKGNCNWVGGKLIMMSGGLFFFFFFFFTF